MTRYQIILLGSGQGFASVQIQKPGTIVEVQHSYQATADGANQCIVHRGNQTITNVNGIVASQVDIGPVSIYNGDAVFPGNMHNATAFPVDLGDLIYVSSQFATEITGYIVLIVRD